MSGVMNTWVNPLAFLEVDEPWAATTPVRLSSDAVLRYAVSPEMKADVESVVARYRQISVEEPRLFAAPADSRILSKLVWPLHHAKASYMLGNYLGTISLCGMVSEMVAILLFQTSDIKINGESITPKTEADLFGRSFESLGQDRRVAVLRAYGLIDAKQVKAFDEVRVVRRRYLHLWSQEEIVLAEDAVKTFVATAALVVPIISHCITGDGKLSLTGTIARYLQLIGVPPPERSIAKGGEGI
jgi:hypothetical protein